MAAMLSPSSRTRAPPSRGTSSRRAAMAPVAAVRRAASRRSRPAKCRVERAPAASQAASSTAVAQVWNSGRLSWSAGEP